MAKRNQSDIVFMFGKHSKTKEIRIIGRGRNLYVWFGDENGAHSGHCSGNETLLKFANALKRAIKYVPASRKVKS